MATARGMWDAAKHPHGEHGHWASTRGKRVISVPRKRKPRSSGIPEAPRIAYETVIRDDETGAIRKLDKTRVGTYRPSLRSARRYYLK